MLNRVKGRSVVLVKNENIEIHSPESIPRILSFFQYQNITLVNFIVNWYGTCHFCIHFWIVFALEAL